MTYMTMVTNYRHLALRGGVGLGAAVALTALVVDPVAAQPGGGAIESALQELIPWILRWVLVIGAVIAAIAHALAGWTQDPDKAYRRKEWRNRAAIGVAGLIPALIILNWIITTFGGQPIDFLPFV